MESSQWLETMFPKHIRLIDLDEKEWPIGEEKEVAIFEPGWENVWARDNAEKRKKYAAEYFCKMNKYLLTYLGGYRWRGVRVNLPASAHVNCECIDHAHDHSHEYNSVERNVELDVSEIHKKRDILRKEWVSINNGTVFMCNHTDNNYGDNLTCNPRQCKTQRVSEFRRGTRIGWNGGPIILWGDIEDAPGVAYIPKPVKRDNPTGFNKK